MSHTWAVASQDGRTVLRVHANADWSGEAQLTVGSQATEDASVEVPAEAFYQLARLIVGDVVRRKIESVLDEES